MKYKENTEYLLHRFCWKLLENKPRSQHHPTATATTKKALETPLKKYNLNCTATQPPLVIKLVHFLSFARCLRLLLFAGRIKAFRSQNLPSVSRGSIRPAVTSAANIQNENGTVTAVEKQARIPWPLTAKRLQ